MYFLNLGVKGLNEQKKLKNQHGSTWSLLDWQTQWSSSPTCARSQKPFDSSNFFPMLTFKTSSWKVSRTSSTKRNPFVHLCGVVSRERSFCYSEFRYPQLCRVNEVSLIDNISTTTVRMSLTTQPNCSFHCSHGVNTKYKSLKTNETLKSFGSSWPEEGIF